MPTLIARGTQWQCQSTLRQFFRTGLRRKRQIQVRSTITLWRTSSTLRIPQILFLSSPALQRLSKAFPKNGIKLLRWEILRHRELSSTLSACMLVATVSSKNHATWETTSENIPDRGPSRVTTVTRRSPRAATLVDIWKTFTTSKGDTTMTIELPFQSMAMTLS